MFSRDSVEVLDAHLLLAQIAWARGDFAAVIDHAAAALSEAPQTLATRPSRRAERHVQLALARAFDRDWNAIELELDAASSACSTLTNAEAKNECLRHVRSAAFEIPAHAGDYARANRHVEKRHLADGNPASAFATSAAEAPTLMFSVVP